MTFQNFLTLFTATYCYVFYHTITNICVVYSRKIVCILFVPVMYKKILRFFLVLHVCDKATITQQCRIVHYTFRWTIFLHLQSFKPGKIWKFDIGICGSFFLSLLFSRSQVVMKKSSNDTFFRLKRGIEWNMVMFSLK